MKTVRYDEEADEELIDEVARYELRREGLGIEFLTAIREAVRLITQNPSAWQASEHAPDVRRFVMERFPFTIVYTELAEEIPHRRGGPLEPRTRLLAQAAVEVGSKKARSQAQAWAVADPVAAELEAALALRRSGADPKALRRALRRIEELLDE